MSSSTLGRETIATVLAFALATLLLPEAHAAVGRTEAAYGVTQNGAASYAIPIRVTEGINGLTPKLAIDYVGPGGTRSRSILGVGFAISGLSYIRPCRKTIAQDGAAGPVTLAPGDRYCLDGARLRSVTGTYGALNSTYRTEVDRLIRVTIMGVASGAPTWFKAEMPDGLIYEYGNSTDSKLMSGTQAGATPQFWAVNRILDTNGNSIRFVYDTDTAARRSRPSYVSYTERGGAGHYQISFVYQSATQPTASVRYTPSTSGSAIHKEDRLLDRIELKHDDVVYRAYKLTYQAGGGANQRLWKVQECAYAPTEDCLPATAFTWQSPTAGHDGIASSGRTVASGVQPLDVNGDGIKDLVWAASGTWRYMLGGPSGFGSIVNTSVAATNPGKAIVLRWNADEFDDLLIDWSDGKWRVLRGGASGFNTTVVQAGPGGIASMPAGYTTTVGDLDADGRDDLITMQLDAILAIYVRFNGANGFGASTLAYSDSFMHTKGNSNFIKTSGASSVRRPDFNGDNRVDLLVWACFWEQELNRCIGPPARWYRLLSAGNTFVNEGSIPGADYVIGARFGNFNDDKLTDIIYPNTSGTWSIGFGRGSGGFDIVSGPSHAAHATYQTLVGDYDGDGLDDFYVTKNSPWQWDVYRSTGAALATTAIPTLISGDGVGWMLLDLNGDLPPDLGRYDSSTFLWSVGRHAGVPGDHLLTATDGVGNKVTFTYLPMSNSTVYVKGSGATFPLQDVEGEQLLVRTMQESPAGGTSYTFTYRYRTAREHLEGRGFLGMAQREITDSRKGIFTVETYQQTFPYIGAPASVTVKQSSAGSAKSIRGATYSYQHHVLNSAAGNQRYLPYRSQSVSNAYEVGGVRNGAHLTKVTEAHTVNTWGNSTFVSIDVEDVDSLSPEIGSVYRIEITSTHVESSAPWCIGLPLTRSDKRILPNATNETRNMGWQVDAAECRVTQETIQPGAGNLVSLVTDIGYNGCGNVSSVSSYPVGQSTQARTTALIYGSRCQQPTQITNPEGHVTKIAYNLPLDLPSTHTDPNGLVTTLEYDGLGRLTRQLRPDGTAARFALLACTSGNSWCGKNNSSARVKVTRTERSTSNGILRTDEQFLDGIGRVRWTHTASLESGPAIVEMVYDASNFMTARSQPYFAGGTVYVTSYTPDLISRVTQINAPISESQGGGRITGFAYEGRYLEVTDPKNLITTRLSNALGHLKAITDPSPGGITTYAYHPFGELKSITDAAGNVTSWTYNLRGLMASTSDPDSGNWTHRTNAFGEMTGVRDAKTASPNWTMQLTYDKLGRPLTRIEAEGQTDFTWGTAGDNTAGAKYIGRLKQVTSPGGYKEEYFFDARARLSRLRTTIDGTGWNMSYGYATTTGLLDTLQYPVSGGAFQLQVQNEYQNNILKRVREVAGGTVYWEAVSTDAWGHVQDETFGNGVTAFSDFDQASGLSDTREAWSGSTPLVNANVDWDLNGNVTKRQDLQQVPTLTEDFGYDSLNRITSSTLNGSANGSVTLNAIGNITAKDGQTYTYTGAQTGCTYYAHAQPRAVRKIGSTVYCYDANGNMVKRAGSNITYTSYNLPSAINSGSQSSALSYGAFRNRYKQVTQTSAGTETTIYVAGLFERVTRPGGALEYRHQVPGGNGIAALHTRISGIGTTYYVHADHLGSPEVISDPAGGKFLGLSFSAYGARRHPSTWSGAPPAGNLTKIADTTRRGFTDHEHLDSVGLIHMNGRVYDPAAGRFLSRDPLIDGISSSQGANGYAYVHNNPLTYFDPLGLCRDRGDRLEDCVLDEISGSASPLGPDDHDLGPDGPESTPGSNRPDGGGGSGRRVAEAVKDFFCVPSAQPLDQTVIEGLDNTAQGAELAAPAAAAAGTAYAVANGRNHAAIGFMSTEASRALRRVGDFGTRFALLGIGAELVFGSPQRAFYNTVDGLVFAGAAAVGVAGVPAGGASIPLMASAMYVYDRQGGSQAIIEQALCSK